MPNKFRKRGGLVSRKTIERMTQRIMRSEEERLRSQILEEDARSIVEAMERAFQQCLRQIGTRFPNDIYTIDDHRRVCDFIIVNRIELHNIGVSVSDFNSKVLLLIDDLHTNKNIPHREAFYVVLDTANALIDQNLFSYFMSPQANELVSRLYETIQ